MSYPSLIGAGRPCRASALVIAAVAAFMAAGGAGCGSASANRAADPGREGAAAIPGASAFSPSPDETAFIDELQHRTFNYFWDLCNPETGLCPDRAPTPSFASVSATGFALTSYPIGSERGWVTREQAARRTLKTLRFFRTVRQDTTAAGAAGYQGFYYHFVDPGTGHRFRDVELSTVDTALLLAGALFCQSYFDGAGAVEDSIRTLAEELYDAADWTWASPRPPLIGHGWSPEDGQLPYDWGGYNEAMILYVIALGSDTHPCDPAACDGFRRGYRWGTFQGVEHLGFAPAFGHQFTQVWLDLRGLQDAFTREHGLDYFENSRRASIAQRNYALANPGQWRGYGERLWGLSACDGPIWGDHVMDGRSRHFNTYWARGASFTEVQDDGTICPDATAGSIAFAPDLIVPLLMAMRQDHGDRVYRQYGFVDALNPTFTRTDIKLQHGWVDPEHGWYDVDYLGIGQGAIVAMIENWRSELIWKTLRTNPHVVRGLRRAGFSGGWLDQAPATP
jgi:hypothetical protein